MIYVLIGTSACAATATIFARHVVEPSLFRRLVRRRFKQPELRRPAFRHRVLRRKVTIRSDGERHADTLDAIGRELRLGSSVHAAVITAIGRHGIVEWSWLVDASREGHLLSDVIRSRFKTSGPLPASPGVDQLALRAIAVAGEGGDGVHAVETAARTLRVTAAITAESQTAVAHTKASIAVLTWVPVLLATWLILRDAGAREFFTSVIGAVCLVLGFTLQWIGRRWVQRLTASAARVESDIPDFVDVVAVHLRSGQPPALAFINASQAVSGDLGTAARQVATQVHNGGRFVDVLTAHRHKFGLRAQSLIDALIDTERDGLPPRELFERLATDAHAQRRRDADARIRALPIRLTLPLVGCILPAYVLLAVVPLLASQLSSVSFDPQ